MINYYTPIPLELNNTQNLLYRSDLIIRNIGYIPVIGTLIGITRITVGIFQAAVADNTAQIDWDFETLPQIRYQGSKLAADGETNIIRGFVECLPLVNTVVLPIWDAECQDRFFLYPPRRIHANIINPHTV